MLTIFHNFLKIYIQPGGHVEKEDFNVINAALREAKEETGLNNLILSKWHKETNIPIHIESHLIPKNIKKQEKEHYHHDFMYIFESNSNKINLQISEVSNFKWVNIDIIKKNTDSFISKSLDKMFLFNLI